MLNIFYGWRRIARLELYGSCANLDMYMWQQIDCSPAGGKQVLYFARHTIQYRTLNDTLSRAWHRECFFGGVRL